MNRKLFVLLLVCSLLCFNNVYAEDVITESNDTVVSEETTVKNDYSYVNEETSYKALIDDEANLLTEEEKAQLLENISPLTEYGHVAFASTNNNPSSVEYFARSYYRSKFSTDSGTIFIIDMSNRKIYIFSDGNNYKIITNSKAYSITDNVYSYASTKEYFKCANEAFSEVKQLLDGGKINEPMRNTSNVFVALTISFLLSFIFVLIKSRHSQYSTRTIIDNCIINSSIENVSAKKTGTHSVYSPVSSDSGFSGGSSGGGGFSGGGGGGGSSGGGGGHSF